MTRRIDLKTQRWAVLPSTLNDVLHWPQKVMFLWICKRTFTLPHLVPQTLGYSIRYDLVLQKYNPVTCFSYLRLLRKCVFKTPYCSFHIITKYTAAGWSRRCYVYCTSHVVFFPIPHLFSFFLSLSTTSAAGRNIGIPSPTGQTQQFFRPIQLIKTATAKGKFGAHPICCCRLKSCWNSTIWICTAWIWTGCICNKSAEVK